VQNFTRLEVPGSGDVHWALAHIRPDSRNLFQFEFMLMPASGSGPTGVTASVSAPGTLLGPNSYETSSPQITLDASKSVSTNTGALSYSWVSAAGYPVPAMTGASTAAPVIQFPSKGTYQLRLTVTDRTGATSTVVVTLRYV
jgi:FtsP/CotA-like multicopper oxidase with cupredoxin domain